jgi:thiol-activated cytolysin
MKINKMLCFIAIGCMALITMSACEPTETPVVKPSEEIEDIVFSAGKLPEPAPDNHLNNSGYGNTIGVARDSTYIESGVTYSAKVQDYNLSVVTQGSIPIGNLNTIYPGNIVQANSVHTGSPATASINGNLRSSINITMTGHLTIGSPFREVSNQYSSVESARQELIKTAIQGSSPARVEYSKQAVYKTEQGVLGISAKLSKLLPVSLSGRFTKSTTNQENTVVFYFQQSFYDLTVDNSRRAADWFTNSIKQSDIQGSTQPNNPLAYINSVTYGRVLIAKITSTKSVAEIEKAIEIGYQFAKGEIKTLNSSTFEAMRFEVYALGGSPSSVGSIANSGNGKDFMENIGKWVIDGAENPVLAVPISYTVNYLSDNTPVNIGRQTNYNVVSDVSVINATTMVINSITFKQLPPTRTNGSDWDGIGGGTADVYYGISKYNGSDWNTLALASTKFDNITSAMLNAGSISWNNINVSINDFESYHAVDAYDYDDFGDDEWMGDVQFTVGNIITVHGYKTNFSLSSSNGKMVIEMKVSWK